MALGFSPDGKLLAFAATETNLGLASTETGAVLRTVNAGKTHLRAVVFSPDGSQLAVGTGARVSSRGSITSMGDARVVEVGTGKVLQTFELTRALRHLWYNKDGTRLTTIGGEAGPGGFEGIVWNLRDGSRAALDPIEEAATEALPLSDGRWVIALTSKRDVVCWDGETGRLSKRISTLPGVTAIATSAAQQDVYVLGYSQLSRLRPPELNVAHITSHGAMNGERLSVAPDGRSVGIGQGGTVRVLLAGSESPLAPPSVRVGSQTRATYSPDGRLIATCGSDDVLRIWATRPIALRHSIRFRSGGPSTAPTFSADGRWVAVASPSGATLFDPAAGRIVKHLPADLRFVAEAALSADGRWLAVVGGGFINQNPQVTPVAQIWDTRDLTRFYSLADHTGVVRRVVFSKKGDRLLTGSRDGTVRLWSVPTDTELKPRLVSVLKGSDREVSAVAISPDGSTVATLDLTGVLRLWNAEAGVIQDSVSVNVGQSEEIVFGADNQHVAIRSISRVTHTFVVRLGAVVRDPNRERNLRRLPDAFQGPLVTTGESVAVCHPDTGRSLVSMVALASIDHESKPKHPGSIPEEWVARTNEGGLDASTGAEAHLRWFQNGTTIPRDRRRELRKRPINVPALLTRKRSSDD